MTRGAAVAFVALSGLVAAGCDDLVPHDVASLVLPRWQRSEIIGLVAGAGTTFAGLPDLVAMLRRQSAAGMNPRTVAILGVFQILWVYYGLLIVSRPVVAWNLVAVGINLFTVAAWRHFAARERGAGPR